MNGRARLWSVRPAQEGLAAAGGGYEIVHEHRLTGYEELSLLAVFTRPKESE